MATQVNDTHWSRCNFNLTAIGDSFGKKNNIWFSKMAQHVLAFKTGKSEFDP